MGSLEGRTIIITGGARGIGLAYARGMSDEGASIVIADIVDASEAVDEITAKGGSVAAVPTDVSDEQATKDMAAFAVDRFGQIDVLVNNAALFTTIEMKSFEEITQDEWDAVYAVNVRGCWLTAKAVAPYMKEQGSGKIINISSMTVPNGTIDFAHYVSSKAAIVGLTRALANELGPWNIHVNTLTPDFIPHDPIVQEANPGVDDILTAGRAFKRKMDPEDMVGTAIFLAGPGSDFMTGQNLYVNGGRWFG